MNTAHEEVVSNMTNGEQIRIPFIIYIASLALPATISAGGQAVWGYGMFIQGALLFPTTIWLFLIEPSIDTATVLTFNLPWLGNFVFLFSIFLLRKEKVEMARKVSIAALVLMLMFLVSPQAAFDGSGAGLSGKVDVTVGYFVWLAAPALLYFNSRQSIDAK